jgi:LacI family transcriptional regulator, galactose operon repressor
VVTRDDVARSAGVSTAVVSYVVNGGPRPVSEATRSRVERAIRDLGYRPNGIARALVTQRSNALALVVPDAVNPFFAQLAQTVEVASFSRGYTLLIGNAQDDPEVELSYVRTFLERGVDGVIVAPSASAENTGKLLASAATPTVVIDRAFRPDQFDTVVVDNALGGHLATTHLIQHGHRIIACLAGPRELPTARDREYGWHRALRDASEDGYTGPSVSTSFSRQAAYEATLDLLSRRPTPTAIFATADEHALGIYRAAAELGRRIPEDLAVVSFDNADAARFAVPALTTVHQPLEQMAERAVALLLARLSDPKSPPNHERLPVQLVPRGSCGCPDVGPTGQPAPLLRQTNQGRTRA